MLHLLLYALLAVLLAGALFLVAARLLPAGEQIAPPIRDEPPWELPMERALVAEDVDEVRLPVTLRGYRFAETDALLDRLAAELRSRDAEIARLRGEDVLPPEDVAHEPTQAQEVAGAEELPFEDPAPPADEMPVEEAVGAPVEDAVIHQSTRVSTSRTRTRRRRPR